MAVARLVVATVTVSGFLVLLFPIPLTVPTAVFFTGAFFGAVAFIIIAVPELASLDSLPLLALFFPAFRVAAARGALFPLPAPIVESEDEDLTFLAAVERVDFALPTMLVKIPTALVTGTGPVGLSGDIGLVN